MGFPWELLGSPTVSDTLETVTLSDGDNIDILILLEDGGDIHGFFEEFVGVFDLVGDGSAVHLDLHEVSLLLAQTGLANLSVGENADDSTVFADALQLTIS